MAGEGSHLVEECRRRAAEARHMAETPGIMPDERDDLLEVERRWLSLARSRQNGGKRTPAAT
jgi:hypothetical protein